MENILEMLLTGAGVGVFLFMVILNAREKEKAEYWERQYRNRDND